MRGNITGAQIRTKRREAGISQESLVTKLHAAGLKGMNQSILSKIERNRRHVYDYELRGLAIALDATTDLLLDLNDGQ